MKKITKQKKVRRKGFRRFLAIWLVAVLVAGLMPSQLLFFMPTSVIMVKAGESESTLSNNIDTAEDTSELERDVALRLGTGALGSPRNNAGEDKYSSGFSKR